jgi:uncharacterized membrane protein YidH (DUF202 family)
VVVTEPATPYDAGLQIERSLLAWRRTALAVTVVSAAGVRFTAGVIGWPAVVLGAAGVALGLVAYAVTGIRYRQVHRHLLDADRFPGNGWPQLTLTAATLLMGLTALTYVLLGS